MNNITTNRVGTFYREEFSCLENLFSHAPDILFDLLEKGFDIQDSRILMKDKTDQDDLYDLYNELQGKNPSYDYPKDKFELIVQLKIPKK